MKSKRGLNCYGQASLEAAALIPTVLAVILLLLQPFCVLYPKMIMGATATEAARLVAVPGEGGTTSHRIEQLCLDRLQAIPHIPLFHKGGSGGWEIFITQDSGGVAHVTIEHELRLLPLVGFAYDTFSGSKRGSYKQSVSGYSRVRPAYLEEGYSSWVRIWD